MTTVVISVKAVDMTDDEGSDGKNECKSFCQCLDILLGITSEKEYDGRFYKAWWNVPDDKAQAVEELVSHTLWNAETL